MKDIQSKAFEEERECVKSENIFPILSSIH